MKISLDRLQEGLYTKRFGKRIVFLRETGSTNDLAKELAGFGAAEGTVVLAETQTTGRGRLDREWVSPKGGLYFSLILRPEIKSSEAVRLVFVAGLAVAEVLHEKYALEVETKWPNDVFVNERKVCGILAEMNTIDEGVNFVVVGVGVNANFDVKTVFPERLGAMATSLKKELGKDIMLEELFRNLLVKLESVYDSFVKEGFATVLSRWKSYASFLGCQVEVYNESERLVGLALDVVGDGALVVKLEDGSLKRVFVGDVSLRAC